MTKQKERVSWITWVGLIFIIPYATGWGLLGFGSGPLIPAGGIMVAISIPIVVISIIATIATHNPPIDNNTANGVS